MARVDLKDVHGLHDVLYLVMLALRLASEQDDDVLPDRLPPGNLIGHWRPTHAIKECIASVVD